MRAEVSRQERILGVLSSIDGDPGDTGGVDWRHLYRRSVRERTAGIVAASIERLGLPVPDKVLEEFRSVRAGLLATHVLRTCDKVEAMEALDGIPHVLFKGMDLVERAYRMPGVRDMADLDFLVPRDGFVEACEALSGRGWRPPIGALHALEAASGDTVNSLLLERGDRTPIHLHWHFANASIPLPYARVPMEEIFDRALRHVLDAEATYVLLCEHAMKHSFASLVHLSDLGAVWSSLSPVPDRTLRLARRWGLERPVRYASILTRAILDSPIDPALAEPRGIGGEGRILLRSVLSGRRWNGLSTLGYLSMIEGWLPKWSFVRRTFAPSEGDSRLFGGRGGAGVLRRLYRAFVMIGKGVTNRGP